MYAKELTEEAFIIHCWLLPKPKIGFWTGLTLGKSSLLLIFFFHVKQMSQVYQKIIIIIIKK